MTTVLAVVSSSRQQEEMATGFWLTELAYPYHHLTRAGVEVHLASPEGGEVWFNPLSDPRNANGVEAGDLVALGLLHWKAAADLLTATVPLGDVDPSLYDAVYTVGGTGPTYDLVELPDMVRVQQAVWAAGKPLGAICHGVVALVGVYGDEGRPLLDGAEVTGYSREEDVAMEAWLGRHAVAAYPEDLLRANGARYSSGGPHASHVVHGAGGRLLTGQNQESADAFGRALAALVA
jgi:putative intracellular protease/amidase